MEFTTNGTCSSNINIEVEDDIIKKVSFVGGCSGNLQGIARLVEGLSPGEAYDRLSGIMCGTRGTSCPDQLSKALKCFINTDSK